MTAVSEGRWESASALERSFWEQESWRGMDRGQRRAEWERHLNGLGLSLASFRGQALLDVGCGPTGLAYFVDADRRVGLDPLADCYAKWNGSMGTPIELVQSQAEAMPLDTASFDAVVCVNCLDHTRDPQAVLAEIARVLIPGGTLVLHVDLDSPLRRLHKQVKRNAGILHPHSLSHAWLRSQLAPCFTVELTHRDPEVFRPTRRQMRYEAFWDGLAYRLTRGSHRWINHLWLKATRR